VTTERQPVPPDRQSRPEQTASWDADEREDSASRTALGCAARLGWAFLGYVIGLIIAMALLFVEMLTGQPEDPMPLWPFYVLALLPVLLALVFGISGAAIVEWASTQLSRSKVARAILLAAIVLAIAAMAYLLIAPWTVG
jgi:hypothetical protein